jgi:hypothetical protein
LRARGVHCFSFPTVKIKVRIQSFPRALTVSLYSTMNLYIKAATLASGFKNHDSSSGHARREIVTQNHSYFNYANLTQNAFY